MTDIIKKKRKQMGMTQGDLAKACGCTWTTISNLERGINVNHALLQKVCDILGLKVKIIDTNPIVEEKKANKNNNRVTFID